MAIASTAANAAAKLGYKERDMVFSPVESRWNHDRLELSRRLGAILTADAATEPLVEYIRRREFRRRHWGEQRYKGRFPWWRWRDWRVRRRLRGSGTGGAPVPAVTVRDRARAVCDHAVIRAPRGANLRGHIRRVLKHPMLIAIAIWAAVHLLANGDTKGTVLFASILAYALVEFVSAVQRHATKLFAPSARHDAMAVAAGIVAALAVTAVHRVLFGAAVVPWGF